MSDGRQAFSTDLHQIGAVAHKKMFKPKARGVDETNAYSERKRQEQTSIRINQVVLKEAFFSHGWGQCNPLIIVQASLNVFS